MVARAALEVMLYFKVLHSRLGNLPPLLNAAARSIDSLLGPNRCAAAAARVTNTCRPFPARSAAGFSSRGAGRRCFYSRKLA
jgi:hypothetical protein